MSKEELPLCEAHESCGGCAGGLVNPTIWTDKLRATYHIRRGEEARGIVLARWGGLGNHRYQVGFSGDVNPLAWNSFAYQPYFSSTAANVGYGFWSHDIEGPGNDHELYTRWIQFAAFSAVFRSHDRGMSGGGCANGGQSAGQPHMNGCSTVKPWNVPTKFFEANRYAMQTRAKWLPLIYNATREAYETGVSILRPMYYEFPEENMGKLCPCLTCSILHTPVLFCLTMATCLDCNDSVCFGHERKLCAVFLRKCGCLRCTRG